DGLAGLRIRSRQCAANLHAHTTRKPHKERLRWLVLSGNDAVSFLYILLELERISLNHYIQIPHWRPAGHVAYRSANQKYGKLFRPSNLANSEQGGLLCRRKSV